MSPGRRARRRHPFHAADGARDAIANGAASRLVTAYAAGTCRRSPASSPSHPPTMYVRRFAVATPCTPIAWITRLWLRCQLSSQLGARRRRLINHPTAHSERERTHTRTARGNFGAATARRFSDSIQQYIESYKDAEIFTLRQVSCHPTTGAMPITTATTTRTPRPPTDPRHPTDESDACV
jgi:hypothetical protein